MTPRTSTAAGRQASAPKRTAPAGHRRAIQQSQAGAIARRVSGPARAGMPLVAPRRRTVDRGSPSPGYRALELVRSLPDSRLIDRLVRGRAWIPVLGLMLVGIVFMQVEELKLGASIGHAIVRTETLQTRNELLRARVTMLADDQRIERLAAAQGMVMPAPGDIGFLGARGVDRGRAAAAIKSPNPAAFATLLSANAAVTQAPTPPSAPASTTPGTASTAPGTASTTPTSATTTPITPTSTATTATTASPTGG